MKAALTVLLTGHLLLGRFPLWPLLLSLLPLVPVHSTLHLTGLLQKCLCDRMHAREVPYRMVCLTRELLNLLCQLKQPGPPTCVFGRP